VRLIFIRLSAGSFEFVGTGVTPLRSRPGHFESNLLRGVVPDMQSTQTIAQIGSAGERSEDAFAAAANVDQRNVQRILFLLLMAMLLPIFGVA
jgi:hypothetical protein